MKDSSTRIKLPPGNSIANGIDLREHVGLVHMVVFRLWRAWGHQPRGGVTYQDLFAAGFAGLYKAAERFDASLGFAFSTFAVWWVRHDVGRAVDDTIRTVRVPVHALDKARKGLAPAPPTALSLDVHVGDDEGRTFGDLLADTAISPEDAAIERDLLERLNAALAELAPRERGILENRLAGHHTLLELGERLGLSRERVRQLQAEGLKHLSARVLGTDAAL